MTTAIKVVNITTGLTLSLMNVLWPLPVAPGELVPQNYQIEAYICRESDCSSGTIGEYYLSSVSPQCKWEPWAHYFAASEMLKANWILLTCSKGGIIVGKKAISGHQGI